MGCGLPPTGVGWPDLDGRRRRGVAVAWPAGRTDCSAAVARVRAPAVAARRDGSGAAWPWTDGCASPPRPTLPPPRRCALPFLLLARPVIPAPPAALASKVNRQSPAVRRSSHGEMAPRTWGEAAAPPGACGDRGGLCAARPIAASPCSDRSPPAATGDSFPDHPCAALRTQAVGRRPEIRTRRRSGGRRRKVQRAWPPPSAAAVKTTARRTGTAFPLASGPDDHWATHRRDRRVHPVD